MRGTLVWYFPHVECANEQGDLATILNIVFSGTYYLELHNAIYVYQIKSIMSKQQIWLFFIKKNEIYNK
jgi:hypothetical protein